MSEFAHIDLKPLSMQILQFLYEKEPMKAAEAAEQLGLGVRQIDAAVTKSLVRYGFVIREHKLTKVLKKEFTLIKITDKGKRFIQSLAKAD